MTLVDQLVARLVHVVVSPFTPVELARGIEDQDDPDIGVALYEEYLDDPRSSDYQVFVTVRVVPKKGGSIIV